ncbi:glycosyltransferase family 1 protein [Aquibacillus kalidii]|uniref:glycosyltransferase family 1 protein n=1 Tax=Aquibacillus kalidii TaxID=2762597 RepID=UPI0016448F8D|nr:glycosyltransferase family 1 protein [Aquibacillus kalidii]
MGKTIRVLMINYKMQCAGIESFIMNMYRNIDRTKVQFDFLVHYKERQFYDDEIEELGGKIYRLSVREDNNFIKYKKDLKNFFSMHPKYDIVHGHMESFGKFYLKAAKDAGVPIRIAHSHIAQRNSGLKGFIKNYLNKSFKTYSTELFACSDAASNYAFGDDAEVTIYNNAIDSERFKYNATIRERVRYELGLENKFVIGHIGRFNTQKNHSFLIDVFQAVHAKEPNAVLLLIGEGDLEPKIKAKVKYLKLTNSVLFIGIRRDVERLYQGMDLFILPSLFEGLPVSGIEAQAAGLKCVFSDNVTRQTTITKNTEYLSLSENVNTWANEILKLKDGYIRVDESNSILESGYDIKKQAESLQNFYIDAVKKLGDQNGQININNCTCL